MIREEVKQFINANGADFEKVSDAVWDFAETNFTEYQSSKCQADYMEAHGFAVKRGVSGMETAFIAEWGSGKPVIAILGENDALCALSQEAGVFEKKPIKEGAPGHGCGHNLLGTAGMEAACAAREYLKAHGLAGTVRYYGCPAEEGGGGKVFLVMDHQFDDVDATVTWHPGDKWDAVKSGLAIVSAYFRFQGKAAHAATPDKGRSALDALELMNVGIQFLREHVRKDTIMHYAITNTGGPAANIVQEFAEGFYILRSPDSSYLPELYERVNDIAKGAALMTGTTFLGAQLINNYANILENSVMNRMVLDNTAAILPLPYTEEELEFGRRFVEVGSQPDSKVVFSDKVEEGSGWICSDVCDVSWMTPLTNLNGCTLAKGTIGHNWAVVAQGKSKSAHRGMHASAEIMANTLLDLIEEPEKLAAAKAEFEKRIAENPPYHTLMESVKPTDYRP